MTPPPHHHDLDALGYNALHALYHPALAEVDAAEAAVAVVEAAVPRIEAVVAVARKVLAQKRAAFHPIQQAFLTNREREMPTDCYQVIASYLDRLSRAHLAECDHHLHDYAIYGGNSGAAVWREGDELEKVYTKDFVFGFKTSAMTPLQHASRKGAALPVRTLLVAKADVHARDCRGGMSPLFWASGSEYAAVVTALLDAHADVKFTAESGMTALHHASMHGNANVIPILISAGANINQRAVPTFGCTPLMFACEMQRCEGVTALLAAGADVNIVGNDDCSPLLRACELGDEDTVTALLTAGPNVHLQDDRGHTALTIARYYGRRAIIDMLLATGKYSARHGRT